MATREEVVDILMDCEPLNYMGAYRWANDVGKREVMRRLADQILRQEEELRWKILK